jgi:hypothetical protein
MHESMHAESFHSHVKVASMHACMQVQIHLRLLLECALRRRSSSRVRLANSRMRAIARSGSVVPPPGSGSGGQCVVSSPSTDGRRAGKFEWMISGRTGGIGSSLTSGAERGRVGGLTGGGGSNGAKAPTFVAIIIPLTFSRRRVSQSALPRRS